MLTLSLPTEAPAGLSVAAWRRIQAGQVVTSAVGAPRTGILAAASALLVTGTSDTAMTYRIGPFVGVSSRDGVGVEFVANDASDTVGTDVAPQANSRIDVIWFRARFPSLTDAGQTTPTFGVTRGVADANPQKPIIPAGAEELATAVVTSTDLATQTVVITNNFRWTALAGGTVPVRTKAEMDAWSPSNGATAFRLDEGTQYTRIGGAWSPSAGIMPRITLVPNASQDVNSNFGVTNWAPPGSGNSDQALGTDWFQYDNSGGIGTVQIKRTGRYRVMARMSVQNANDQGIAAYIVRKGDTGNPITQDTVRTHPSYGSMLKLDIESVVLAAGTAIGLYIAAATQTLTIGGNSRAAGEFTVVYLGPA